MKPYLKSKPIAIILALLVLSMPIALAQQINYITDANGNLVGGDNYYREYNEFNQLVKIRQGNLSTDPLLQEYFWHPVEERILEKRTYLTNGALKERILYINENYIVIENQSGRYNETYIYQEGALVAQIDTNGNKQAMHSDHEGSSSLITDSNGNLVEITFYSPFGEILEGGKSSRFDYEGKEFDPAVQDYDFHFRKYNPSTPIFHQPDTLIQNVYDPQFLNHYAFERGNPYKNTDTNGHQVQYFQQFAQQLTITAAGLSILTFYTPFVAAGVVGYFIGSYAREQYPPQQLANDLKKSFDFYYAFAGPQDAWRIIIESMGKDIKRYSDAQDIANILEISNDFTNKYAPFYLPSSNIKIIKRDIESLSWKSCRFFIWSNHIEWRWKFR